MSVYADMSEEDLVAAIADLKAKIQTVGTGSGVRSIAGEGRRVEFFAGGGAGGSLADLKRLLNSAELQLALLRGYGGSAIGVRFP